MINNLAKFKRAITAGTVLRTTDHKAFGGYSKDNEYLFKDKDLGFTAVIDASPSRFSVFRQKEFKTIKAWCYYPLASECTFSDGAMTIHSDGLPEITYHIITEPFSLEIKEHREDGSLLLEETRCILPNGWPVKDLNYRVSDLGYKWFRTGKSSRYWDNGQLNWELNYDEKGHVIKDGKPSYRRDGTVIT